MADRKAVIKNADMSEDMQQDAVDCATQALEKYNIEKDIAVFIRRSSTKRLPHPARHVGQLPRRPHETSLIYFYLGQVAVLLFKVARRRPRGRARVWLAVRREMRL